MLLSYLELGKIVSTHGIKGELRVQYWCDSPEFFKSFTRVYLKKDGAGERRVLSARPHGNVMLLTLEGVDDTDKANALRGRTVYVKREDAPLPAGRYFIAELIGCTVRDADDAEKTYGVIKDVTNSGASDIWHIENDGRLYLLPSIPEIVKKVDVENGVALITPIPGIFGEEYEVRED